MMNGNMMSKGVAAADIVRRRPLLVDENRNRLSRIQEGQLLISQCWAYLLDGTTNY